MLLAHNDKIYLYSLYRGLPPARQAEFDNQRVLIGDILEGRKGLPGSETVNVDKNDPCPCGSGKKFRNCHGRGRTVPNAPLTVQNTRSVVHRSADDLEQAFQRYFDSIGGREGLLRRSIYHVAMYGQPCDVLTRSRQRYIDVRIHHNIVASFMYGLTRDDQTPDRITLTKAGSVVATVRAREIWVIHPMPENGFTEEELQAVDMAEGDRRAPNGFTIRQMVQDTYNCKSTEELDFFLRRYLAS